jgi:hypothetical protein
MSAYFQSVASVTAPAAEVFDYLDDPAHLTAHMDKPSWMMAGGSMHLTLDAAQGKAPGARMRLAGRMLGIALSLEEEVTERVAPVRKSWLPDRWLGRLFARGYARWCTGRMVKDAVRHFASTGVDRHQPSPGRPG